MTDLCVIPFKWIYFRRLDKSHKFKKFRKLQKVLRWRIFESYNFNNLKLLKNPKFEENIRISKNFKMIKNIKPRVNARRPGKPINIV